MSLSHTDRMIGELLAADKTTRRAVTDALAALRGIEASAGTRALAIALNLFIEDETWSDRQDEAFPERQQIIAAETADLVAWMRSRHRGDAA